tara:strand:+ start:4439 stop:5701 length:1263 start_codon:yes stop_codon:yes gene_type:complete
MPHVLLIGLNHKTAPIKVRETVSFSKDQLQTVLHELGADAEEAVILATCNRTEIYAVSDNIAETSRRVKSFFSGFRDNSSEDLSPYLYELIDTSAVRHLFRVASGMDSLVLGEPQILGQVRHAYTAAVECGSAGTRLSKLFHKALRVGKKARHETDIGRHATSVGYVCVELVRERMGELRGHSALVVGAGDAARHACEALTKSGIGRITVTNRTYVRAQDLADRFGGSAVSIEELEEAISKANVVISATGSPFHVINADVICQASDRDGRPLVIVDMATPRDVDPEVKNISGVSLFDLDDLEAVSTCHLEQREEEALKVEAIIEEEISTVSNWWASPPVEITIAALHRQAEDLRQREVARFLRARNCLTDAQQTIFEEMSRSLVKKLLHYPCSSLRSSGRPTDIESVGRLFNLASSDIEA